MNYEDTLSEESRRKRREGREKGRQNQKKSVIKAVKDINGKPTGQWQARIPRGSWRTFDSYKEAAQWLQFKFEEKERTGRYPSDVRTFDIFKGNPR